MNRLRNPKGYRTLEDNDWPPATGANREGAADPKTNHPWSPPLNMRAIALQMSRATALMTSMLLPALSASAADRTSPSAITYPEANQQRIYAFVRDDKGDLSVNYWDTSWHWANQGVPLGTTVADAPSVISYPAEANKQRIYAFVRGANGHLGVNYWDTLAWHWADQGVPPGTTVADTPGVISYSEVNKQHIYAFVRGANGHLGVNYWDTLAWHWADQGVPLGTTVTDTPGAISYSEANKRYIYAFVRAANGHLGVNYWDTSGWHWPIKGFP
jgi:hypothetical protein